MIKHLTSLACISVEHKAIFAGVRALVTKKTLDEEKTSKATKENKRRKSNDQESRETSVLRIE
jgi:hypothetical protein